MYILYKNTLAWFQLKWFKLRNLRKFVILRNQWIKEYLINLDNNCFFFIFKNYKNDHNSLIWQNQAILRGVLNKHNLDDNAKKLIFPPGISISLKISWFVIYNLYTNMQMWSLNVISQNNQNDIYEIPFTWNCI